MKPQEPILTTIPESNSASNCNIFKLVRRTLDLVYRGSQWHDTAKSESENLGGNKIFRNAERENNFKVEKVGHKSSVVWNHKYSESIHIYPNHTN